MLAYFPLQKCRFPELRFLFYNVTLMTAGSFWSSKCCSMESRAGKPAQNVGIVAIALAGSNKLSFIFDPEVSLSPRNIDVTIAA